MRKYGMKKKM